LVTALAGRIRHHALLVRLLLVTVDFHEIFDHDEVVEPE